MRRILAILVAALMLAALPAAAQECSELEIVQRDTGGPLVGAHTPGEGVWTSIVGHYLWVHIGEAPEAGREGDDAVTVDVADTDIIGATVCPDGTVTLHRAEPPQEGEAETPAAQQEDEVVDLGEVYADFQPLIDALLEFRPF